MTKILKSVLITLSIISILPVFSQQNNTLSIDSPHRNRVLQQNKNYSNFDNNMIKYDVIYQKLHFTIDPAIYYIKGDVSIHYKAKENIDSLILNLSDSLTIDSITQRNNLIQFSHQNHLIRIKIDNTPSGNTDSIVVHYQGEPSKENDAFFIGVQDSINYIPVLATLSEPYGSSDWWPCKNNLTDKIDSIDINITCPISNRAISLGLLTTIDTNGTKVTYRWKHRYPVTPYLVSITISDYYEYHSYININETDSILFLNYLYHNNLESKKNGIDQTPQIFNLYDSLFTPYPFSNEKYGHVEFPIGGGMEHQTISSMGRFDFGIISHELAHQWFGDYITCNSWEDLWLNEGFASYCTILCYEHLLDGYWWPIGKEMVIERITEDSTGTVFPIDTNNVPLLFNSRLTYHKASYVLHMIRWTIGDDAFYQSIKNYLNNEELAFSFAKTPDLISHFEQQADTSLTEFMDDWFYGEGYPIYNIEWSQNENHNLHLQVNQSSALNDNHFFKLFVPIQVIGENDTLNLKLNNQFNSQTYNIDVNFTIDTIIFDPYFWLISKNSTVLLNILELDKTKIKIYPNPCSNKLIISSNNKIEIIEITNINGQNHTLSSNNNIFDISSFSPGVYFLRINYSNKQYTKKIIIE